MVAWRELQVATTNKINGKKQLLWHKQCIAEVSLPSEYEMRQFLCGYFFKALYLSWCLHDVCKFIANSKAFSKDFSLLFLLQNFNKSRAFFLAKSSQKVSAKMIFKAEIFHSSCAITNNVVALVHSTQAIFCLETFSWSGSLMLFLYIEEEQNVPRNEDA